MSDPTPNLPLLRKVLDTIRESPETWRQSIWMTDEADYADDPSAVRREREAQVHAGQTVTPECGTAYCFAGHAVAMTEGIRWFTVEELFDQCGYRLSHGDWAPMSGKTFNRAGQDQLGLTDWEAMELFRAGNKLRNIESICRCIAARAGEEL